MKRSSGILLPITALPSPYGVGTLGQAAYDFAEFLSKAGQSWWQVLPVGPTGYGDSPYQSFSTFAGNPYLIDLDLLCADGLLSRREVSAADWGSDPAHVDYGRLFEQRFLFLRKAAETGLARNEQPLAAFYEENRGWLLDYALFMALKQKFSMKCWLEWPEELRVRKPEAMAQYKKELRHEISVQIYVQYLFHRQWKALKEKVNGLGIGIIGDLPIYVAMDSADVWASPESFQLDEHRVPTAVAGVPPDYFSKDGQLWGNPLYRWDRMKQDGFGWWIRRVEGAARLFDVLRIDHFRGFESYWAVPYGETTARKGQWMKGPGMELVGVLTSWFYKLPFIAEDLGILTPEVTDLLKESGLPGMKVLEFAFDGKGDNAYLPHTYEAPNCVCYVGTHDNAPVQAWKTEAEPREVENARAYLNLTEEEGFHWGMIRGGMASTAALFVAQLQDCLGLGPESRMNTPGSSCGNWTWRVLPEQLTDALAEKLRGMTERYGRL